MTSQTPRWHRYVAIGDSFTEGLWDPYDTGEDGADPDMENLRGWADRLAATLSRRRIAAGQTPLLYANLAIRGRRLARILDEQLQVALDLQPDLISIIGGGIDILRVDADPDRLAVNLEDAVVRAKQAGCDVLLATSMDTRSGGPLLGSIRGRFALYSAHINSIAHRHGCFVLDQWGMRALAHRTMWNQDRIHLSAQGHHRLSQGALVALGLEPDDPGWRELAPAAGSVAVAERVREDAVWLRRDVAPWIARGLRGQSTGDGRSGKRPDLAPMLPTPSPVHD